MRSLSMLAVLLALNAFCAEVVLPKFEAQAVDTKVAIGYGVAVGDVDGDGKPDIILVDKKQVVWYQNPDWTKYVICENVTKFDNVCVAARDIDGDGKVEIAIGANWNPGDTVGSGSVHYLIPPADRKQPWEVVNLPNEPVIHRMKWVQDASGKYVLVVAPLHGRGNKNAEGAPVKLIAYTKPDNPRDPWKTETIDESMHLTHNLNVIKWNDGPGEQILFAGKENVVLLEPGAQGWKRTALAGNPPGEKGFAGAGEVRSGKLPNGKRFIATVEPFHGNQLVVYTEPKDGQPLWQRKVIDATLKEGHALACADLAGVGSDQIVCGWRMPNAAQKVGINIYSPADNDGQAWTPTVLDENGMACEDLVIADLNGDGHPDIIASGRATNNLKIYWNKGK